MHGPMNVKFVGCLKQWLDLSEGLLMTYERTQSSKQRMEFKGTCHSLSFRREFTHRTGRPL